jgi:hypothetical protein
MTVLATAWATRGAWRINSSTLDLQLGAVLVATFLVSYHSHMHGLALLAVPLAAVWRAAASAPVVRLASLAFVFVPTVIFVAVVVLGQRFAIDYAGPLWVVWPVSTVALLVVLLGATILGLRSQPWSA